MFIFKMVKMYIFVGFYSSSFYRGREEFFVRDRSRRRSRSRERSSRRSRSRERSLRRSRSRDRERFRREELGRLFFY